MTSDWPPPRMPQATAPSTQSTEDLESFQQGSFMHTESHEYAEPIPEARADSIPLLPSIRALSAPFSFQLSRTQVRLLIGCAIVVLLLLLCAILGGSHETERTKTMRIELAQQHPHADIDENRSDDGETKKITSDIHTTDIHGRPDPLPPLTSNRKKSVDSVNEPSSTAEPRDPVDESSSTIGAPRSGPDGTTEGPTFDQRIIPTHLPWQKDAHAAAPLGPFDPDSVNQPKAPTGPTEAEILRQQSWIGPTAFSTRPFIPSMHFDSNVPRFVHLTDLHLEPAYDPEHPSTNSALPGVCRRDGKGMEMDWFDEASLGPMESRPFPLGRYGCDTPLALLQSSMDFVSSLATPLDMDVHARKAIQRQEKSLTQNAKVAEELGGIDPPNESPVSNSQESSAGPLGGLLSPSGPSSDVQSLPPYDFAVVSGDLVAHFVESPEIHQATLAKALELTVTTLAPRTRGGSKNIFPCIGNTDLYPTGYIPEIERDEWIDWELKTGEQDIQTHHDKHKKPRKHKHQHKHDDTADKNTTATISCHPTYHHLLTQYNEAGLLLDPQAQASFCQGGYYSQQIEHLRLRIVVLNSMPWSSYLITDPSLRREIQQRATNDIDSKGNGTTILETVRTQYPSLACNATERSHDPYGQFSWLDLEYSMAEQKGQQVLLIAHQPPGHKDAPREMAWCPRYYSIYQELVESYPTTTIAGLFGDFSEDLIRFAYPREKDGKKEKHSKHSTQEDDAEDPSVFDPYNAARLVPPSSAVSSSSISSHPHPIPLVSMFVAPGLSPRKHLNPSVRVWYLQAVASAGDIEEGEVKEQADVKSKDKHTSHSTQLEETAQPTSANHTARDTSKKHPVKDAESSPPSSPSTPSWLSIFSSKEKSNDTADDAAASAATPANPPNKYHTSTAVRLLDYTQWYLPLQYANGAVRAKQPWSWQYEYSFLSSFELDEMTLVSLASFPHRLATNPELMTQYELHVSTGQPSVGSTPTYTDWLCDIRYLEPKSNEKCKTEGTLV